MLRLVRTARFARFPGSATRLLAALLVALGACTDSTGPLPEQDVTPPTLVLDATPDSSVSILATIAVTGVASDNDIVDRLSYSVNGGPAQNVTLSASKSVEVSVEIPLALGENRITVRAHDQAGNTTAVERLVDRREPGLWRVELRNLGTGEPVVGANAAAAPALLTSRSESPGSGSAFSPVAIRAEIRPPRAQLSTPRFLPGVAYRFVHAGGGIYHIYGPEGYPFDLTITADGFQSLTYQGITLGPEPANDPLLLQLINDHLVGNGGASGIVVDNRSGEPVADAEICVVSAFWHATVPIEGCLSTRTDGDGRYTFTDLPLGYYTVFASKRGYTMARRQMLVIGGTTIADQHLTIEPQPTATLTVAVATIGISDAPSRFTLVVDDARTLSIAPDGMVTLANLPVGEHTLELKDLGERCTLGPSRVVLDLAEWTTTTSTFTPNCSAPADAIDRIYFASTRHTADETAPALYFMNADGTGLQSFPEAGAPSVRGDQPNVSPDGTRIAYRGRTTTGGYEILVANIDGTGIVNLTSNPASDQQPKWSPDGKKIAFTSSRDGGNGIYVMNAEGSNVSKLATGSSPTWSPDGLRLAFVGPEGLAVINIDGSNQRRLVSDQVVNGYDLAWSPDGKKIAFGWAVSSNQDIYVLDLASSAISRLTTATAHETSPSWSPDGKTIAFASDRIIDGSFNLEVYLVDAIGGEAAATPTNLTLHSRVDKDPAFAPALRTISPPISVCQPVAANASARPGRTVHISGIPESIGGPQLAPVVRDASGKESPTAAYRTGRDEVAVLVPLHPSTGTAGGTVTLTMGTAAGCGPIQLTIEALPAAPGATRGMVTDFQEAVSGLAANLGMSAAELNGDLSGLPRELLPLGVLQRLIDHSSNPNSMARMVDGTAPALAGTSIDLAMLDALVASSGAAQAMEEFAAALRTSAEAPPSTQAAAAFALLPGDPSMASLPGSRSSLVRTAKDLDYWMGVQSRAAAADEMLSSVGEYLSHVLALVSLVPGASQAATVVGMTMYFNQLYYDGLSSVLPSTLTSLTVSLDRNVLAEDDRRGGHWSNAQLIAYGGEWRLTATTLIDGWLNAMGASGVLLERMAASNPVVKTALEETLELALPTIAGTINTVAGGAAFEQNGGAYAVGPFRYGPVDVTGEEWTQASSAPSGILRLPAEDRTAFFPQEPGTADLIIRIRPNNFGGNVLQTRQKVEVKRIVVRVEPGNVLVEPGTTTQFLAATFHATDERVSWAATGGSIDDLGVYTAPQTPGTYTIRATSLSKPERFGTATVHVQERILLRVTPSSVVLVPGGTRTFIAEVEGTGTPGVTWSASGGTIEQDGRYAAPAEPGIYRVTATSQANPEVTASAEIRVSSQVMLRINPSVVTLRMDEGDEVQFKAVVEGTLNTAVEWRDSHGALIDQNGVFRADNLLIMTGSSFVTVTARSKADPSATAEAVISFSPSPPTCTGGTYTMWLGQSHSWSPCVADIGK